MSTPVHVACTADGHYLPFCATMLRSLFRHAPGRVTVHYLCPPEFSPHHRDALTRLVRDHGHDIAFHAVADADVAGLPPMRSVRRLVWYRVFLPGLLPDVDRLLYLDADLLVVDRLDALWQADLQGRPLAAVPNVIEPDTRRRLLPALGLPVTAPYFNSGVMVMDLRAMRAAKVPERVLAFARRHGDRLVWGDQDALNGVLCHDYRALHPRWNCMNALFHLPYATTVFDAGTLAEAVRAPAILHFEGPDAVKPWHVGSTHPRRAEYLRELRATLWRLPLPLAARLAYGAWYALPMPLRRLAARLRRRRRAAPDPTAQPS